jgi:hypothetical protein
MTVHRGVLRGDEYVDRAGLLAALEVRLGFTIAQVHSVYRQGRQSTEQGELRARIDARLLALSLTGANMLVLARTFGWKVKDADKRRGELRHDGARPCSCPPGRAPRSDLRPLRP